MIVFFEKFKKVACAVSDKNDGNMSFKISGSRVIANREEFLAKLNLNLKNLVTVSQPHENKIVVVGKKDKGRGAYEKNYLDGYDGLVTDQTGLVLGVEAADCALLFLYEPRQKIFGAVHLGWRCLEKNIISELAKILKNTYNCLLSDFYLALGPHLRQCCFEVKKDVVEKFAGYRNAILNKNGKDYLDLAAVIKFQLKQQGFDLAKLEENKSCTCCEEKYFSFRKEKKQLPGEMLGVISAVN